MQSSCWKHPCINQHQQGKMQTQISKECKEKSNPVKSKYFLSATSSRDQQRKKSRGDKPAIYFLLESSLFGFTVFLHCTWRSLLQWGSTASTLQIHECLGTTLGLALLWHQLPDSCNRNSAVLPHLWLGGCPWFVQGYTSSPGQTCKGMWITQRHCSISDRGVQSTADHKIPHACLHNIMTII